MGCDTISLRYYTILYLRYYTILYLRYYTILYYIIRYYISPRGTHCLYTILYYTILYYITHFPSESFLLLPPPYCYHLLTATTLLAHTLTHTASYSHNAMLNLLPPAHVRTHWVLLRTAHVFVWHCVPTYLRPVC